jgi:hypothetical protein
MQDDVEDGIGEYTEVEVTAELLRRVLTLKFGVYEGMPGVVDYQSQGNLDGSW